MMKHSLLATVILLFATPICAPSAETSDTDGSQTVSYDRQVRPIFQAHCLGCHQPAKAGGEFVMTSFEELLQGGESEQPSIVPGSPIDSYLIDQITAHDGEAAMPKNAPHLTEAHIQLITKWIADGALNDSPASLRRAVDQDHPPEYSRPPVITALDVSPNGNLLAVSGFHEVLLHSLDGSDTVTRLIGQSERIESVRFSPDGKRLAVSGGLPGQMGEVQIWDVDDTVEAKPTGRLLLSKPVTYDSVYGVSWSPDGNLVGFGCADTSVRAINAETGEEVLFQGIHDDWVLDTTFSMDGSHLVSVGRDMTAKLTELATQRFIDNVTSITPKALKGGIQAIVRHPLRDEVIFGGADGVPKIYQMHRTTKRQIGDDANQLWELPPLPGRIFAVDVSVDGRRIVAGSSLNGVGHIQIYDMEPSPTIGNSIRDILRKPTHKRTESERTQLQNHFATGVTTIAKLRIDSAIYAVAISSDGTQVVAGGTDGIVRQIDGSSGKIQRAFSPVEITVEQVQSESLVSAESAVENDSQIAKANVVNESEIESLEIIPRSLTFSNPSECAQAVVTAKLRSGQSIDVTRNLAWESSNPSVIVSPSGLIEPAEDGKVTLTAKLGDLVAECRVEVAGLHATMPPDYIRDVNPILSKVGCNGGTCHGAQDGKNGFKLSLRGYDPLFDVRALTDDLASRRVNLAAPAESMMLQKSTAAIPHEGGQVIKPGSPYYKLVRDWIAGGAKLDRESARVKSLSVFPVNPVVERIGATQQVRVIATYEDGNTRDVTREAFVDSNDTDIIQTDSHHNGLMHALRRGEAALLIRYEGAYASTILTVMGDRDGFVWQEPESYNQIDEFVSSKLRRTKTLAAPTCDDYTFLRRTYLDLTGLPPTPDVIRGFVGDNSNTTVDRAKRAELIDDLIGSDEFVEHWTNKWADLLQVNGKFLGRDGAVAVRSWIRQHVDANTPYDQFVREILTAQGSTQDNPAAAYFKILRSPQESLENTTHLFLATRFNCNKCHDHPFERWTQDQYYQLGAFFAQVGRKADPRVGDKQIGSTQVEAGKPLHEIVYDLTEGELQHDRTGELTPPEFPFECDFEEPADQSRRSRLAAWTTSPDNVYFARSYVNRLWGYLTGRGIIEPIDDIRAGNPPSNPELLDYLTREFIESNFDTRHILRLISNSRTYQLSVESNRWNVDDTINYSHAIPRRLPAETLYDAIHVTTGARSKFPDLPEGTRAAALPDAGIKLPDGFLGKFGRPARESACECERSSGMQLGPVIALISGPTLGDAISDEKNEIVRLANETAENSDLIGQLYLRLLNRPASASEIEASQAIFVDVTDDHDQVTAALRKYEAESAPRLEKQKQARAAQLAEAKHALADYEKNLAPKLAKREDERSEMVSRLDAEIADRLEQLETDLANWEDERRSGSRWTPVDPVNMVSSNNSPLTREADLRIYGAPRGNDATYNIVAKAPLPNITGIRIDAIADKKRLRKGGPGNGFDGNYILTEFEAAYAAQVIAPPVRFQAWDFASDSNGWTSLVDCELSHDDGVLTVTSKSDTPSMLADVDAPAGKLALELVADVDQYATIEVLWRTEKNTDFSHDRKAKLRVVEGGKKFRRYVIYFEAASPITGLRIDADDRDSTMRIDSMALVQLEAPVFAGFGFRTAQADFSEDGYHVSSAIDGKTPNVANGWGIAPQVNRDHAAIFATDQPIGDGHGLLQITMKHFYKSKEHQIGLFRLSVTSDTRPISFGLPTDIGRIVDVLPEQRTDQQRKQLMAYVHLQDDRLREKQDLLEEAKKPLPPDERFEILKSEVAQLSEPVPPDAKLTRLRRAVELSEKQLASRRLTAAQDLAWALMNSPAFLYNH